HKLSDKEKEDISKKNFFKYPKPIITRIKNSLTDVKPIISKISTDDQGWLYVFRKLPAKRKDDDAGYVVDIFNPEGKYLYKAQCKWPFQFVGKHLWSHTYVNDSHLLKSFKLENGFK
ncbi:MAG: hypothetical protein GY765_20550, partial [bacterium]|nr:hypothetical protein [bacterium]